MNRLLVLTGAAVVGSTLVAAAPAANAAPSTALFTVPFTCDDGATGVAQVDVRGLPMRAAWIDGRGIAPRAFAREESGTVYFPDGSHVDYSLPGTPGLEVGRGGNQLVRNPASLSGTTACALPAEDFDEPTTLTVDDLLSIGADPSYAGVTVRIVGHGQTTVYLGTAQLAART